MAAAQVLEQIGAGPDSGRAVVEVWNKIDLIGAAERDSLANLAARRDDDHRPVLVSAVTGEGLDALTDLIEARLGKSRQTLELDLDPADGAAASWLHRNAEVLDKKLHDGRFDMTVRVDETKRDIVVNRFDAVPHGA